MAVDLSPTALAAAAGVDPWGLADQVRTGNAEAIRSAAVRVRRAGALAAEAARAGESADLATAAAFRTGAAATFDAAASTARGTARLAERGERLEETARALLDVADALTEAGNSVTARLRTLDADLTHVIRLHDSTQPTGPGLAEQAEQHFFRLAVDAVRSAGQRVQNDLDGYEAVLVNRSARLGASAPVPATASLVSADTKAADPFATTGDEPAAMGNALLNNLDLIVAFLAGAGLVALGVAGVAGGGVVTVGSGGTAAVAGVPVAGLGYGAVAAGIGIMLAAAHDAARAAGGADRVEPFGSPEPDPSTVGDVDGPYRPEDVQGVAEHLERDGFTHSPMNDAMLERINSALAEGRPLTEGEHNFMKHELTERELMDSGLDYDTAHAEALETHPLGKNYDPEVIEQYPEHFSNVYRKAWGLPPR